jgi:DNA processing protein
MSQDNSLKIKKLPTKDFPPLLKEINDPPKRLFMQGMMPKQSVSWVAVVGSRKLSSYGKEVINHLISSLSGYEVVIVSGLAIGADSYAHRAALDAGLPTVAFPGSGLDPSVLYPRSNVGLANAIIKNGCLLSEFDNNQKGQQWTFPKRNRLMAGSCCATIIVEATERSGTLITARLAMEYNRDVLAVPGSIFSRGSSGPHKLIRDGAIPITCTEDLHEVLGLESKQIQRHDVSTEAQEIMSAINNGRDTVDQLIAHMPDHNVLAIITELEIKGIITTQSNKILITA